MREPRLCRTGFERQRLDRHAATDLGPEVCSAGRGGGHRGLYICALNLNGSLTVSHSSAKYANSSVARRRFMFDPPNLLRRFEPFTALVSCRVSMARCCCIRSRTSVPAINNIIDCRLKEEAKGDTRNARSKNLEIRGFNPSRLLFGGVRLPRTEGSPQMSRPCCVNSYFKRQVGREQR